MNQDKIEILRNKSSTYMLPLFGRYVPLEYFHLLKNTYFWYDDLSEDTFCLLFKYDGKIRGSHKRRIGYPIYEQKLRENEYYIGECDYNEHVIFKFKLPEELIDAKITIVGGRYSKLSEEDKKCILDFMLDKYGRNGAKTIKEVLYKEESLRLKLSEQLNHNLDEEAELSSILNIDNELFSNHVITKKEIDGSKNYESREWNPWTLTD